MMVSAAPHGMDGAGFSARRPRATRWAALAAAAALGLALALSAGGASACTGALSGRAVVLDGPATRFGIVQGQPPLGLAAGEYVVTIDDGPNPKTTPALLDVLAEHCVKATFFLVGQNAEKHPDLVRRILAEGHGVGSHSFSHANFSKLTTDGMAGEIEQGARAVEAAAGDGRPPRLFRFPGATGPSPVLTPASVELAVSLNLIVAGYDLSPQDWRNSPPKESFGRLFNRISDRGVIVFHDGQSNTIALLPMVFDELRRRHATIATLAVKP